MGVVISQDNRLAAQREGKVIDAKTTAPLGGRVFLSPVVREIIGRWYRVARFKMPNLGQISWTCSIFDSLMIPAQANVARMTKAGIVSVGRDRMVPASCQNYGRLPGRVPYDLAIRLRYLAWQEKPVPSGAVVLGGAYHKVGIITTPKTRDCTQAFLGR